MTTSTFRDKLCQVIFRHDTKAGSLFDIIVIWLIFASVSFVVLESIRSIDATFHTIFHYLEWGFTILFTIEYILRLYASKNRWRYATSFYGIIDLIAILPSYLGIFIPSAKHLLIIRVLRLMRIFRIFEMGHFVNEGAIVAGALRASRTKITVFLSFLFIVCILMGALMYMLESEHNTEIQNIPEGIYWAIVTLTTVGYGDTVPVTSFGKILASVVMVLGYGVIAVPTGIVTAEISSRVLGASDRLKAICKKCGNKDHLLKSSFCHSCGEALDAE